MNNPNNFFKTKQYLLKKEAFIHNPSDRLNIIPWLKLIHNKQILEKIEKDDTFMEQFLMYSYDYSQLSTLIDFKIS